MNQQQLIIIKQKRNQTLNQDSKELQEKRMKFLDWLIVQEINIPQVLEMYPKKIKSKKQIPQYFHEIKFCNTRTQLTTETRVEIDKLSFEDSTKILCEVMLSLIRKKIHFFVFYAEGQRSFHVIIYDFGQLAELKQFQRTKAQAKFWRWIAPFSFHLFDHSIWDSEHYVPLEFSTHWKYGTLFNLLFEYKPQEEKNAVFT